MRTITRGFTLVEMAVVLGILILLAAMIVPVVGPMLKRIENQKKVHAVVAFLQEARNAAVTHSTETTVEFPTPSQGKYTCIVKYGVGGTPPSGAIWNAANAVYELDFGSTVVFPAGTAVDNPRKPPDLQNPLHLFPPPIVFHPDGSCEEVCPAETPLWAEDCNASGRPILGTSFFVRDGSQRKLVRISHARGRAKIE